VSLSLSDLNLNINISTIFLKIIPYQIALTSIQPFSNCYVRADREVLGEVI